MFDYVPDTVVREAVQDPDMLMGLVVEAGGRLALSVKGVNEWSLSSTISRTLESDARPPGKRLHMRSASFPSGTVIVELEDNPEELTPLRPVPLPEGEPRDHPVAREVLSRGGLEGMGTACESRAALILQALADECDRRGHAARVPPPGPHGRTNLHGEPQLEITVGRTTFTVRLRENGGRGRGTLEMRVAGLAGRNAPRSFRDRKASPLEDRLGEVLKAFEAAVIEAANEKRRTESAAQERAQARSWMLDHARRESLTAQYEEQLGRLMSKWLAAKRRRAFLDELSDAADRAPDGARDDLQRHLTALREMTDFDDPLCKAEELIDLFGTTPDLTLRAKSAPDDYSDDVYAYGGDIPDDSYERYISAWEDDPAF